MISWALLPSRADQMRRDCSHRDGVAAYRSLLTADGELFTHEVFVCLPIRQLLFFRAPVKEFKTLRVTHKG